MIENESLSPAGTVRRRRERGGSLDAFLESIAPGCETFDLGPERLALVREIVLLFRHRPDGSALAATHQADLALLLVLVFLAGDEGSTRLSLDDGDWLQERLRVVLGDDSAGASAAAASIARLRALVADPALDHVIAADEAAYLPLVRQGPYVYAQRMLFLERALTNNLAGLLNRPPPAWAQNGDAVRTAYNEVLTSGPFALKPRQAYGLLTAVQSPVTVVSGGPGTGKTTIVVSLLRMLVRLGVPIEAVALAAPTGKAAYRMGESIEKNLRGLAAPGVHDTAILASGLEPQTLHRLLGYLPDSGGFRHHEGNRLAARVVIVDEASMIDLFLMDRLVRAVGAQASLVLLGDADQLPSVEAGAVFRDLVPPGFQAERPWAGWIDGDLAPEGTRGSMSPFAVRLHENVRVVGGAAGAKLQSVAAAINARQGGEVIAQLHSVSNATDLGYEGAEWLAVDTERAHKRRLHGFLRAWHARWFTEDATYPALTAHVYDLRAGAFTPADLVGLQNVFAHLERTRLLSPTRVGLAGTGPVNAFVHELAAGNGGPSYVAGEPVLMLQNDYERKVYNGDQGVILTIDAGDGPELAAVFQRAKSFLALALPTLGNKIEHAYAITVHKSQGSEFESVAVLLPVRATPFLTKEILYTAATRCKRSLVFVGAAAVLTQGVALQIVRHTGIQERLTP